MTLALSARSELIRRRQIVFTLLCISLGVLPAHPLFVINPGLTNSRVLYFSSVGLVILLAVLLAGIDDLRTRRCALVALSLLLCLGLLHNLNAWRWTSRLSGQFIVELQRIEPSPYASQFLFLAVPDRIRGIYFIPAGLQSAAVKLAYGREDLKAVAPHSWKRTGATTIKIRWKNSGTTLLEREPN